MTSEVTTSAVKQGFRFHPKTHPHLVRRVIIGVAIFAVLMTAAYFAAVTWGISHRTLTLYDSARQRPVAVDIAMRRDVEMRADAGHALHRAMPALDLVLTYGGGPPVVAAYEGFGARACIPVYNALDPRTHHPVPPDPRFSADLAFLGNRLPDREARVERFFLEPAARNPEARYIIGGSGWETKGLPGNVTHIGHVGTADHNAFNTSAKAVLNMPDPVVTPA